MLLRQKYRVVNYLYVAIALSYQSRLGPVNHAMLVAFLLQSHFESTILLPSGISEI